MYIGRFMDTTYGVVFRPTNGFGVLSSIVVINPSVHYDDVTCVYTATYYKDTVVTDEVLTIPELTEFSDFEAALSHLTSNYGITSNRAVKIRQSKSAKSASFAKQFPYFMEVLTKELGQDAL